MTGAADTVALWAGIVAAVGGAVTVLYRWGRSLRRASRRVGQVLSDWAGEPERPGVPARPGVMERLGGIDDRLSALDQQVQKIDHELHPNSGASLRDAVDRLDARTAHLEQTP